MSSANYKNVVKFTSDTVIKSSPEKFIDCAIELEQSVLKHLRQCGINVPKIINYKFGSQSFIEMERFDGPLFDSYLKQDHVSLKEAYFILLNCLYQLATIHEHGVTHGDVHGENIILKPTNQLNNTYLIQGDVITIPSYGKEPVFIDYGLSYLNDSLYKADLSITYSGIMTSCHEDQLGDVIKLLAAATIHKKLNQYIHWWVYRPSYDYVCVDTEISAALKALPQTKKWQYKFFTAELFNILRLYPYDPIYDEEALHDEVELFLQFLSRKARFLKPFTFFSKLKSWYFKQKHGIALGAGSAVINYFLEFISQKAMYDVYTRREGKYPFASAMEAVRFLEEKIKPILEN